MSRPIPSFLTRASAYLWLSALSSPLGSTQTPDVIWHSEAPIAGIGLTCAVLPMSDGGALFAARVASGPSIGRISLGRMNGRGDLVATRTLGTASFRNDGALASDTAGGAFFLATIDSAGFADPPLGAANFPDLLLMRVDGALNTLWVQRLGTSDGDFGYALEADGSGGAYFAGSVSASGNFGGVPLGITDGVVGRVTSTGGSVFTRRYGQSGDHSAFRSLTRSTGGVWCGADSFPGVNILGGAVAIVEYDANGGLAGVSNAGSFGGQVPDIEADGLGGYIYFHDDAYAWSEFVRHDSVGTRVWTMASSSAAWNPGPTWLRQISVTALGSGRFVLGGLRFDSTTSLYDTYLRGIDAAATTLWEATYAAPPGAPSLPAVEDGGFGTFFFARNRASVAFALERVATTTIGAAGCTGRPNSTGSAAELAATGSALRTDDSITIYASGLPLQSAAYFLCSTTAGFVAQAGGSQGDFCLGGAVGRFVRPGEVWNVGNEGRMHQVLSLGDLPSPTGSISAVAGQTWRFQAWYRDTNPSATSNFTGSWSVPLQ